MPSKAGIVICGLLVPAGVGVAQEWRSAVPSSQPYTPLTPSQRLDNYARGMVGWSALGRTLVPAAIDHARMRYPEWDGGVEGFSTRWGNRYARFVVRRTIEHGASAALGFDTRYIPCYCPGTGQRVKYAFANTFVTYNRNGRWVPRIPRFAASVASEYITPRWLPPHERENRNVAQNVGIQFGLSLGINLVREFTPEWKRLIPFKKR